MSKGLEVFIDANFIGGFNKSNYEDATATYSCTKYTIKFTGYLVV